MSKPISAMPASSSIRSRRVPSRPAAVGSPSTVDRGNRSYQAENSARSGSTTTERVSPEVAVGAAQRRLGERLELGADALVGDRRGVAGGEGVGRGPQRLGIALGSDLGQLLEQLRTGQQVTRGVDAGIELAAGGIAPRGERVDPRLHLEAVAADGDRA